MKKNECSEIPMCGYPRLVIFRGEWSDKIYLYNQRPSIALVDLKHWEGALVITEYGQCFKIKRFKKIKKITPWYLRGWFEYTYVEAEEELLYCQFLSFDNLYPILWEAIRHATNVMLSLNLKNELIPYTSVCPEERLLCGYEAKISPGMKRCLEKQLENRIPLRTFFETIALRTIKADQASAFI